MNYLGCRVPSFAVDKDGPREVVSGAVMAPRELVGDGRVVPVTDDDDVLVEVSIIETTMRVLCFTHHQGTEDAAAAMPTWW